MTGVRTNRREKLERPAFGMNRYAIKDKSVIGQRDSSLALGMTRLKGEFGGRGAK